MAIIRGLLSENENAAARIWRDLHTCHRDAERMIMIVVKPGEDSCDSGHKVTLRCVACNASHEVTGLEGW